MAQGAGTAAVPRVASSALVNTTEPILPAGLNLTYKILGIECGPSLSCASSAAARSTRTSKVLLLLMVLILLVPAALAQKTPREAALPAPVTTATDPGSILTVRNVIDPTVSVTATASPTSTNSTAVPIATSIVATPPGGPCNGFACPNRTTTSATGSTARVNKALLFSLALVFFVPAALAQVPGFSSLCALSTTTTTMTRTRTVSTMAQQSLEIPTKAVTLLPIATLPPATAGIPEVTTVTVAANPNAGGGYSGNCANGLVCGEPYSGGSRSAAVPSASINRMLLLLALLVFLVPPALGQTCSAPNTNTLPSNGQQRSPSTSDCLETAEQSVEVVSRLPLSLPLTEPLSTSLEPLAAPYPVISTPDQTSTDASCTAETTCSSYSSSLVTTAIVGSESLLVPKTTDVVAQGMEPSMAATTVDTTTPLWTEITLQLDQPPNMTCDNFGATISAGLWLCPGNGSWVRSEAGRLVFPRISLALAIVIAFLLPVAAAQRGSSRDPSTLNSTSTLSSLTIAVCAPATANTTTLSLHEDCRPSAARDRNKETHVASQSLLRGRLIALIALLVLFPAIVATKSDTIARDDTPFATDAALVCERKRPWACHWVPDRIRAVEGIADKTMSGSLENATNVLPATGDKSEETDVAVAESPTRVNFTIHDPTWVYNPFTPPPHTHQWTSSSMTRSPGIWNAWTFGVALVLGLLLIWLL